MQFSSAYSRSQPGATWMHEPAVEPQLIRCYHRYSLRPAQDAGKTSLSPLAPGTRSHGTQSSGGTAPQAPRRQHQQADGDARKLTQTLSPSCHAAHLCKGQNPLCHYPHATPKYLAVASAYQRLLRLHGLETKRLLLPWLLPLLLLLLLQLKEDEHWNNSDTAHTLPQGMTTSQAVWLFVTDFQHRSWAPLQHGLLKALLGR